VSRPRALVLTTRLPWPLDDGGHIGNYQTVWSLSRAFDTTLLSFVPPGEEGAPVPDGLAALGIRLVRVAHRPPPVPIALLRGLLGRWPYTLARYRSTAFEATLRRLVAEVRPAFAFVNALHLTTYFDALGDVPAVLRAHNLEHLWLARYAERLANPLARLYARDQARRIERTEAERCARCRLVLAIREEEAALLRALAPGTRVETVPLGIDMDRYRPREPQSPPVVALVGSWEWAPNVDGARSFLARGWPRVRARMPSARLRLVGKRPSPEFSEFARRAGAEVVGYVDDMTAEFARAAVLVVPLWMGSGVRVKIVEALAARVPVATTPMGAEGLGLEQDVHAAIAGTPEALGDAVAGLLEQPARARALAEAGHGHVAHRFSLAAVARRTVELCSSIAPASDAGLEGTT
jgi:glycosyltransferase involved in cell wall biosynthesis